MAIGNKKGVKEQDLAGYTHKVIVWPGQFLEMVRLGIRFGQWALGL